MEVYKRFFCGNVIVKTKPKSVCSGQHLNETKSVSVLLTLVTEQREAGGRKGCVVIAVFFVVVLSPFSFCSQREVR